jgi:DNA-binding transcriptional ArsR family regulator
MTTTTPIGRLVLIHKAIAHPIRLRLLAALRGGPLCVCQMTVIVKLAASTVSEHLSELRKAGLIVDRKDGRWVEYRLSDRAVRDGVLEPLWPSLEQDVDAKADALLVRELRRIPLDELCAVDLDLSRLKRPRLAAVLNKAEEMRGCCEASK